MVGNLCEPDMGKGGIRKSPGGLLPSRVVQLDSAHPMKGNNTNLFTSPQPHLLAGMDPGASHRVDKYSATDLSPALVGLLLLLLLFCF